MGASYLGTRRPSHYGPYLPFYEYDLSFGERFRPLHCTSRHHRL